MQIHPALCPDGETQVKEGQEGQPKVGSNEPVYREEPCPNCGKRMVRKKGRFGFFWGCEGYPACKTLESIKKPKKKAEQEDSEEEGTGGVKKTQASRKKSAPATVKNSAPKAETKETKTSKKKPAAKKTTAKPAKKTEKKAPAKKPAAKKKKE